MKRGLITWDKSELPPEVFAQRIARVREVLAQRNLAALLVYSDLWRSNQARFFCNYMPYFNRALLIIPRDMPLTLLCGLSPRVYGWIRSVTTIEDVRPAGNFAKPLFEIAAERSWTDIGALDLSQFQYDIHKALHAGPLRLTNVEFATHDETEDTLKRKASAIANQILDEEIPSGIGLVDYHFVGRLERRFRRAGVEDLVVLLANDQSVPAPATGVTLTQGFSVSVAVEYRGHWARITRPPHLQPAERLDGSYPYEL